MAFKLVKNFRVKHLPYLMEYSPLLERYASTGREVPESFLLLTWFIKDLIPDKPEGMWSHKRDIMKLYCPRRDLYITVRRGDTEYVDEE